MVLVDKQELEKISINLCASLGEDDPTILSIPAMSDLEKVIEESISVPVINVVALKGVAEVLEQVLDAAGPHILTKRVGEAEWDEEITREKLLEFHIEHAIEIISELVGKEDENKKTHYSQQ